MKPICVCVSCDEMKSIGRFMWAFFSNAFAFLICPHSRIHSNFESKLLIIIIINNSIYFRVEMMRESVLESHDTKSQCTIRVFYCELIWIQNGNESPFSLLINKRDMTATIRLLHICICNCI